MEFQYAEIKNVLQINERLFVVFLNTINILCTRLYIVATTTETAGNFAAVVVVVQVRFQKKRNRKSKMFKKKSYRLFFQKMHPFVTG